AVETETRGGVFAAWPCGCLARGHRGRRVRRCVARTRARRARSTVVAGAERRRIARAVRRSDGAPGAGRADPRRTGRTAAVAEACDQGAGGGELRRPAWSTRCAAGARLPA